MTLFAFPEVVNERAARLVAGTVAATLVLAGALGQTWVLPLVALGFLLRVAGGPRFSPLARGAVALAAALWPVRPVAGRPKRFAQAIGATCTVAATALAGAGYSRSAWAVAGVVALCATLEATLGFCVGCFVYARVARGGVGGLDECAACARLPLAARSPRR